MDGVPWTVYYVSLYIVCRVCSQDHHLIKDTMAQIGRLMIKGAAATNHFYHTVLLGVYEKFGEIGLGSNRFSLSMGGRQNIFVGDAERLNEMANIHTTNLEPMRHGELLCIQSIRFSN